MTLYFVEHSDPYLRSFYLFTAEKEPGYGDYYFCMGIDIKTMHIKPYNDSDGIHVHKRFVKDLVPIDDVPIDEMFGDLKMYKKFEWSIKMIRKQLGA